MYRQNRIRFVVFSQIVYIKKEAMKRRIEKEETRKEKKTAKNS